MPVAGDDLRTTISFTNPVGGLMQNTFHHQLTAVGVNSWTAVADDIEGYLTQLYTPWLVHVAPAIASTTLEIALRDSALGQWNTVISRAFTTLVGSGGVETSLVFGSPRITLYPGSLRHWGFRNVPPPAETAVTGGQLDLIPLAALAQLCGFLVFPYAGVDTSFNNGIYSLATEVFRGFIGTFVASAVMGSRVTRIEGEGI